MPNSLGKRLPFRLVPKCLRGVTAKRRYLRGVSKFLGFLLGVAVALAGPAVFGVLEAPGGIELNAKEMALAFGIGALIFWAVVSYFSGAGALGAFVAFCALIYCWLWIPNRTTNFLNDVPGVTTGMIDGSKQFTLNGVVPILAVISLVYAIQLIVRGVQRRRRERAEAERLQREQEVAQAQQEADAAAVYPVAGSTYPAQYGESFGNSNRFDDLFDDEPEPVRPHSQADEQTAQYPASETEHTAPYPEADAPGNDPGDYSGDDPGDDTVLVPTDRDETVQAPSTPPAEDPEQTAVTAPAPPVAEPSAGAPEAPEPQQEKAVAPQATQQQAPVPDADEDATQEAPKVEPEAEQAPRREERAATEQAATPVPAAKEQMGSQYRERMDDPEDTGEFHLTAFENPVVRPARA